MDDSYLYSRAQNCDIQDAEKSSDLKLRYSHKHPATIRERLIMFG